VPRRLAQFSSCRDRYAAFPGDGNCRGAVTVFTSPRHQATWSIRPLTTTSKTARAFDNDYRTHLTRFLQAQLRELNTKEPAGPADPISTQQTAAAARRVRQPPRDSPSQSYRTTRLATCGRRITQLPPTKPKLCVPNTGKK
jgi:hypothetical protein